MKQCICRLCSVWRNFPMRLELETSSRCCLGKTPKYLKKHISIWKNYHFQCKITSADTFTKKHFKDSINFWSSWTTERYNDDREKENTGSAGWVENNEIGWGGKIPTTSEIYCKKWKLWQEMWYSCFNCWKVIYFGLHWRTVWYFWGCASDNFWWFHYR